MARWGTITVMATRRAVQPVVVTEPHPRAWEEAKRIADEMLGEVRPVAQPDGSVLIVNQPTR